MRKTRRRGEAARRPCRDCKPGLFRADPRSESWKSVSNPLETSVESVSLTLTYVFCLHYTGPVLSSAIFAPVRGGSMRSFLGSSLVMAMLALGFVGCGKVGELQAMKAFKAANQAYQQQDYKKAVPLYEETISAAPETQAAHQAYFFLGNSYDQQFKPSKKGEPENDALLAKAVDNYAKAAETLSASPDAADKKLGKLSLDYLVAAYGADKLNDPAKAEPVLQKMIQAEP